jgi:hypothetical protein
MKTLQDMTDQELVKVVDRRLLVDAVTYCLKREGVRLRDASGRIVVRRWSTLSKAQQRRGVRAGLQRYWRGKRYAEEDGEEL